MLDRQYLVDPAARIKRWQLLIILCVIAIACASCNNAAQQTSSSRGRTVQAPRVTVAAGLPLTDSAPPQLDVTPTVSTLGSPTPAAIISPATPTSYEAEASQNTLAGGAHVIDCKGGVCSDGARVGDIGLNAGTVGTLRFNNINKESSGQYTLTIDYLIAGSDQLTLDVSVSSGPAIALNVAATANGDTIGTASITVNLHAGNNTIEFSNPSTPAPDIDRIVV